MQMKLVMNSLSHFVQDIKEIQKHQGEGVILFLNQFNFCVINVARKILNVVVHVLILQTE